MPFCLNGIKIWTWTAMRLHQIYLMWTVTWRRRVVCKKSCQILVFPLKVAFNIERSHFLAFNKIFLACLSWYPESSPQYNFHPATKLSTLLFVYPPQALWATSWRASVTLARSTAVTTTTTGFRRPLGKNPAEAVKSAKLWAVKSTRVRSDGSVKRIFFRYVWFWFDFFPSRLRKGLKLIWINVRVFGLLEIFRFELQLRSLFQVLIFIKCFSSPENKWLS